MGILSSIKAGVKSLTETLLDERADEEREAWQNDHSSYDVPSYINEPSEESKPYILDNNGDGIDDSLQAYDTDRDGIPDYIEDQDHNGVDDCYEEPSW